MLACIYCYGNPAVINLIMIGVLLFLFLGVAMRLDRLGFLLLLLVGCTPGDRYVSYAAVWYEKPIYLELCDDLNVDSDRIIEQVNWWHTELGDSYPYFEEDMIYFSDCSYEVPPLTIRVHSITTDDVFFEDGNTVTAAYAEFGYGYEIMEEPPGSYNPRSFLDSCTVNIGRLNTNWVIRHEFGHCWGWAHTESDQWSHLMSPWVGRNTEGLENMPHEDWVNWQ